MVTDEMLETADALGICPACYQEYIPGNRHIRIHCFSKDVYAVQIKSEALNWRGNLDVPFTELQLHDDFESRLFVPLNSSASRWACSLQNRPGQNSCIVEVNSQGNFFCPGTNRLDLAAAFDRFLQRTVLRLKSTDPMIFRVCAQIVFLCRFEQRPPQFRVILIIALTATEAGESLR